MANEGKKQHALFFNDGNTFPVEGVLDFFTKGASKKLGRGGREEVKGFGRNWKLGKFDSMLFQKLLENNALQTFQGVQEMSQLQNRLQPLVQDAWGLSL